MLKNMSFCRLRLQPGAFKWEWQRALCSSKRWGTEDEQKASPSQLWTVVEENIRKSEEGRGYSKRRKEEENIKVKAELLTIEGVAHRQRRLMKGWRGKKTTRKGNLAKVDIDDVRSSALL
jgi:hypothetical protein